MKSSRKWLPGLCGSVALIAACTLMATTAPALEATFDKPTYKKMARLDVCYTWGQYCGQKAADTYCFVQGYDRATHFETERTRPTRIASGGKVCDADFCVGFKSITCYTSASQRGKIRGWPQRLD